MQSNNVDILIRANDGRIVAATEVKAYRDLSPEVATAMRQTLLEHKLLPKNAYFLLISQDNGYLWQEPSIQATNQTPLASFSMEPIIQHYAQSVATQRLRETELAGSRAIPLASSYGDESAVAVATPSLLLTAFYLW